jgi:zinc transporter ZupT
MATLLGSMVVFMPRFYKPIVLGISLALAAGVMIYVSFIEIFFKGSVLLNL